MKQPLHLDIPFKNKKPVKKRTGFFIFHKKDSKILTKINMKFRFFENFNFQILNFYKN